MSPNEAIAACLKYAALCLKNGPNGKVGEAVLNQPENTRNILKTITSEDLNLITNSFFLSNTPYYKTYSKRQRVPLKIL